LQKQGSHHDIARTEIDSDNSPELLFFRAAESDGCNAWCWAKQL